jgi:hypothetical protein
MLGIISKWFIITKEFLYWSVSDTKELPLFFSCVESVLQTGKFVESEHQICHRQQCFAPTAGNLAN